MKGPTRNRLLSEGSEFLASKGRQDARLSAEILLAHVLGIDRTALFRDADLPVSEDERGKFREFLERRGTGEPVAYLTGEREFFSLPFYVNRSVLIPRPETEVLVECVLEKLKGKSSGRVIDVGTGSGAVAITLKKHLPELEVLGSDVSEEILDVARKNAARHDAKVRWIRSDLLGNVEGKFEAIVANIPYIPSKDIQSLHVGVRDFEPHRALDGGPDGLHLIRRLADEARGHLKSDGLLILEISAGKDPEVRKLLQTAEYAVESVWDDPQGIPRVVVARSG